MINYSHQTCRPSSPISVSPRRSQLIRLCLLGSKHGRGDLRCLNFCTSAPSQSSHAATAAAVSTRFHASVWLTDASTDVSVHLTCFCLFFFLLCCTRFHVSTSDCPAVSVIWFIVCVTPPQTSMLPKGRLVLTSLISDLLCDPDRQACAVERSQ